MSAAGVQLQLHASGESAHTARRAAADYLVRAGREDLIDDVTLIVGELVGNVVMHARTDMTLALQPAGAGVRVTVTDTSHVLPRWTPPSETATAGRGLMLVERLSRRWGLRPGPRPRERVWARSTRLTAPGRRLRRRAARALAGRGWPALPPPRRPGGPGRARDRRPGDARQPCHTEDLVGDLKLTLLNTRDPTTPTSATARSSAWRAGSTR
jgi:anti-sigma regulatory factor (Ser/Thr protein kinase)